MSATAAAAAAAAASKKNCDIETANPMFPQGIKSPKLHLHRTSSREGNLLSGRPLQLSFMVLSIVPVSEPLLKKVLRFGQNIRLHRGFTCNLSSSRATWVKSATNPSPPRPRTLTLTGKTFRGHRRRLF